MALTVKIRGDASHLEKAMGKAKVGIGQLGNAVKMAGVGIAAAGVAIAGAAVAAGAFYSKMILVGEAALTSEARLENIVKQMGVFGSESKIVSDRLSDLADTQARAFGIDNKSIRLTQAKLATFKELLKTADDVGGAFDRATQAALDMAAAGFGEAEQNAVQLGKALQDPIKGITALARSGITFTAQEREKVKALVESNQMFKAQDMVLRAIEKQVGGTSKATADASAMMKESYAQLVQEFAKPFAMSITGLPDQLEGMFPKLKKFAGDAGLVFSTAIQDAFTGDFDRLVEAGVLMGKALLDGIELALKVGAPLVGKTLLSIFEEYNPIRAIPGFDKMERRSERITVDPTVMESGIAKIAENLASGVAELQFRAKALELYNQGFRESNPIYQGTEMGEMLRELQKLNGKLGPIKF